VTAKVTVKVRIDKRAIDKALLDRDGNVGFVIAGFAGNVTKEIKAVFRERAGGAWWPVRTSINQSARGTYATINVKKSKAHKIVTRGAPSLVFYWERENRMFKGPSVNHPGSSPHTKLILSGVERASRRLVFTAAAPVVTES
jgi:hypothetical protein